MTLNFNVHSITPVTDSGSGGGGDTPSDSSGWKPSPEWWDIKSIIENDTRNYASKLIALFYDLNNSSVFSFTTNDNGCTAVETSDGAFYSYAQNGSSVTHIWDKTKDKVSTSGFNTRYAIFYTNADISVPLIGGTNGSNLTNAVYIVFKGNIVQSSYGWVGPFQNNPLLQGFDFIDGFNFKNITNLSNFCSNCASLQYLPEILNTSAVTNWTSFCSECYQLTKLPAALDTSAANQLTRFCSNTPIEEFNLDTQKAINFYYFGFNNKNSRLSKAVIDFSNAASVSAVDSVLNTVGPFEAFVKLPVYSIKLNVSNFLTVDSMRYIAEYAPAASATLTIGAQNLARANSTDENIIKTLTDKGWTVN